MNYVDWQMHHVSLGLIYLHSKSIVHGDLKTVSCHDPVYASDTKFPYSSIFSLTTAVTPSSATSD